MFGIDFTEAGLLNFFAPFAYQPLQVYSFVIIFMLASSFGLPIPEELTLIAVGLVANMGQHPEIYPPPFAGAGPISIGTLCLVAYFAVFLSDVLVYLIGKYFGAKIIKTKFFQKQVAGAGWDKVNSWFQRFGGWACGIFRFTPGIRFPGHLSCGILGIPFWKFCLIDGLAALISVPTQVYLISTYGRIVLSYLKEAKMYILAAAAVGIIFWIGKKIYLKNTARSGL